MDHARVGAVVSGHVDLVSGGKRGGHGEGGGRDLNEVDFFPLVEEKSEEREKREERQPRKRNCREQSERVASILFPRAPNE
jgi:hypothetical protein